MQSNAIKKGRKEKAPLEEAKSREVKSHKRTGELRDFEIYCPCTAIDRCTSTTFIACFSHIGKSYSSLCGSVKEMTAMCTSRQRQLFDGAAVPPGPDLQRWRGNRTSNLAEIRDHGCPLVTPTWQPQAKPAALGMSIALDDHRGLHEGGAQGHAWRFILGSCL